MNKTWCKHIQYSSHHVDDNKRYFWWMKKVSIVPKSWKMCPICGKLRPTKPIVIKGLKIKLDL